MVFLESIFVAFFPQNYFTVEFSLFYVLEQDATRKKQINGKLHMQYIFSALQYLKYSLLSEVRTFRNRETLVAYLMIISLGGVVWSWMCAY